MFYSCLHEYDVQAIAEGAKHLLRSESSGYPPTVGQLEDAIYAVQKAKWEAERAEKEEEQRLMYREKPTPEQERRLEIVAMTKTMAQQKGFSW